MRPEAAQGARVSGFSTLGKGREGNWECSGGLNCYIRSNNVKLQTDVAGLPESPISNSYIGLANVNDNALFWRVQLQLAF